jgi:HK97 family phage major capsid protein
VAKNVEAMLTEMLGEVQKSNSRIEAVEKTVFRMSKATGDATSVLRAAVGNGGQNVAAIGFDGSDTLGLLKVTGGVHQKSIGWGSYLKDVAYVSNPGAFGVRDVGPILKSLDSRGCRPVQKTALAEGSGAAGGYTVPVQFYADLLRLVAEDAFVRQMCTVLPMMSKTLYAPALTQSAVPVAGTSAFFGGVAASWQPEAANINESEPVFRQITLTARDLVFYTVASNQLLQDNAVALDTLLTTLFKEAMAWFYDYYILRGDGSDAPLGILNAPAVYNQTRTTANSFVFADVANMVSHLLMSSWKNAIWVMHPSVLPQLMQLADSTNGRLVWMSQFGTRGEGGAAQKLPVTLLGMPVYFTEKVPVLGTKGDVMLIDCSKYIVGDRLQLQIETSPHVKFLNNQMVWRIIARWDGQPWMDKPVTLADGSGTYLVSPYVVLN